MSSSITAFSLCVNDALYTMSSLTLWFQLLDLPGIIEGAKDGKGRGKQVIAGKIMIQVKCAHACTHTNTPACTHVHTHTEVVTTIESYAVLVDVCVLLFVGSGANLWFDFHCTGLPEASATQETA